MTCGVVVTDGARLLIGQAARSPLWDLPKGMAEAGEEEGDAALRELREETGLEPPRGALVALGRFDYLPAKDLSLFLWRVEAMPDPASLRCTTYFYAGGRRVPEILRFDTPPWDVAANRLGRNMQRVLAGLRGEALRADVTAAASPRPQSADNPP
ncbi:NUDIX hydrolase [Roseomonas sp. CCTCC AB2023176]|uniref:NUDIX hydrolase n=1 Tax=Roseomonas sp. CCTCC AB2023176 TaxID=3342640 RepID=UPI0035DBD792